MLTFKKLKKEIKKMEKQTHIYIILEEWRRKHEESGVEVTVFSSYENMKEYYKRLKEIYKEDYSNNEDLIFDEDIDDKKEMISLSAYDEYSSDSFEITCYKEEIKS